MDEQWRGALYPARLPIFHRLSPPPELADRIRWVWIPEWTLAPGRVSRQDLLPFPALNFVVQPDGVTLSGPATRLAHRDLEGSGWAVGALLRPAAVPAFTDDPGALRDTEIPFRAPDLHAAVLAAMSGMPVSEESHDHDDGGRHRTRAAAAVVRWFQANIPPPAPEAELANRLEQLIQTDNALIRRYRLQEAAERLRTEPRLTIADIAAELGYADHAHLTGAFREVLGFTPSGYRWATAPGEAPRP